MTLQRTVTPENSHQASWGQLKRKSRVTRSGPHCLFNRKPACFLIPKETRNNGKVGEKVRIDKFMILDLKNAECTVNSSPSSNDTHMGTNSS